MQSSTSLRIIDVHHHILPPEYLAIVGDRLGPQTLSGAPLQWSPTLSLETMDRNGIAVAVTSFGPPGFWFGDLDETQKLARVWNEYAADLRRDYPRRFGIFAALPLPDVDSTLKEIEYALDTLRADGVCMLTNYAGTYPGDKKFAPVFEELNRRKAVIYFHPAASVNAPRLEGVPAASLEFPFDTTRAITSLLYSGRLARCRNARFLFSHAGGTLPFLVERIARLTVKPELREAVPDGVLAELQHLYYDTALAVNQTAFPPLYKLAKATNVLFGSDYPHAGEPTVAASVLGLTQLGLTSAEVSAIAADNATSLLPALAMTSR